MILGRTHFESAVADGAAGKEAACRSDVANIVAERAETVERALVVASPASAATETCSLFFRCRPRLSVTDSAANESVEECLRVTAPESDA